MKTRFRDFAWLWVGFLGVLAVVLIALSLKESHQTYGLINYLPFVLKILAISALILGIATDFAYSSFRGKMPFWLSKALRYARYAYYVLIAVSLGDLVLVWLISKLIDAAGWTSMPEGDVNVMAYLLVSERKSWASGLWETFRASLLGTLIGFLLAVLLSYVRTNEPTRRDKKAVQPLKYGLVKLEKVYAGIVRGTPMMVQACIIYYAGFALVRSLMPGSPISQVNQVWSLFLSALITVSLNSAAYLAEVLRGGIEGLDKGQREAYLALGMSERQGMLRVVYPQAIKASLPSLVNELINNIKGTSILTVIGYGELMFATTSIAGKTYQYLPAYFVAAILYLVLILVLSKSLNALVNKALSLRRKAVAQ